MKHLHSLGVSNLLENVEGIRRSYTPPTRPPQRQLLYTTHHILARVAATCVLHIRSQHEVSLV